ncbi:hypothetical protein C7S17_5978 [Burkholderia thailandensis]|nr:hypothetical protein [Burkholderia thailandensis]
MDRQDEENAACRPPCGVARRSAADARQRRPVSPSSRIRILHAGIARLFGAMSSLAPATDRVASPSIRATAPSPSESLHRVISIPNVAIAILDLVS